MRRHLHDTKPLASSYSTSTECKQHQQWPGIFRLLTARHPQSQHELPEIAENLLALTILLALRHSDASVETSELSGMLSPQCHWNVVA